MFRLVMIMTMMTMIMTLISILLIMAPLPFSLLMAVKVVQVSVPTDITLVISFDMFYPFWATLCQLVSLST